VELTLTLPLAKRAQTLKSFLETHPDSKARPRAKELLLSTYAGLGDQFLKNGDVENGIKHLQLAIDEAEPTISDKLFNGVIGQIPPNLYARGQSEAAFKAADKIEAKFGSNPKHLLVIAGFYLGLELGDQAARVAGLAVNLAPDMAEAHRVLALSNHVDLKLDEAGAEYKKTIALDPSSRVSRSSLADIMRANSKAEEALALYEDLLKSDPKDRSAIAGKVLCLFELGRKEEATTALEAALTSEPRNLALLSGVAYWYAAHSNYEKSFDFARRAIAIEPRYTWAQIALVRSLIGMKNPVGAERALRYAKQYGKFPTLNYELATVLAAMGFYDEAAAVLTEAFAIKDGQIETYLASRIYARDDSFIDLLSPERRASIFQPTPADTRANSKALKGLLALTNALFPATEGAKVDEDKAAAAAREFGSGTDTMRTYRQLYAANRLLRYSVALPTALELAEEAKKGVDSALDAFVATSAVQADEYRDLRAQALVTGNVPDIADAERSVLSSLLRGRIEDTIGWILFNQEKNAEAIEHLKRAATILPKETPSWRNAEMRPALINVSRRDFRAREQESSQQRTSTTIDANLL
jgi:tetratricopeptide (TPR) repeat protein